MAVTGISFIISNSTGQPNGGSWADLSYDGSLATFTGQFGRTTFLPNDSANPHTYLKDLDTGQFTRVDTLVINDFDVDVSSTAFNPVISEDGRYVAFQAQQDSQIYVRDLQDNSLFQASTSTGGAAEGDSLALLGSRDLAISADGRYVVFQSDSSNLVAGDDNEFTDIFLKDTITGETFLVSEGLAGADANDSSFEPSVAADGDVVFWSFATNLVSGTSGQSPGSNVDIYIWDRQTDTIISPTLGDPHGSAVPAITPDGRFIVFESNGNNFSLTDADTNTVSDIYVYDRVTGLFTLASVTSDGLASGNAESTRPSISANGRYVVFESDATNFVDGDDTVTSGAQTDIFVKDLVTGAIAQVNLSALGVDGNSFSFEANISGDGHYITFASVADNLLTGEPDVQNAYITVNPFWESPVVTGTEGPDNIAGNVWGDEMNGAGGDDTISGGAGDDTVRGGPGNDSLLGGAADDALLGEDGNDTMAAAGGDDSLNGGIGADLALGGAGADTIEGGDGSDRLEGSADDDSLVGGAGDDTLLAAAGDDSLLGGAGNDSLAGGGNEDTLLAAGGNDVLLGGSGNDSMLGGAGADTMDGGDGADRLEGSSENDSLFGGNGDDTILAAGGADTLLGGEDNDSLAAGGGDDRLDGGNGADTLVGVEGNDTGIGGAGNDSLDGGNGNDSLLGGGDDDTLQGGEGADALLAAGGNDRLLGGNGNDTLLGGAGEDTLDGGDGNDRLEGSSEDDSLAGGNGADTLLAASGNDVLDGGADADSLAGGGGNDSLFGGSGADTMLGGDGNDLISGDAGDDSLIGGNGADEFLWFGDAPGDFDVIAGDADTIVGAEAIDVILFGTDLVSLLTAAGSGSTTAEVDVDEILADTIDGSNSIAFNPGTELLMIDVDGNGSFDAAADFSVQLIGVASVAYAGEGIFTLTLESGPA